MGTAILTLCGSERNLYGKQILCDRPYHHSTKEMHRAVSTGLRVFWDGAPSVDISPRIVPVPADV